jgi:colicin import membrane protein
MTPDQVEQERKERAERKVTLAAEKEQKAKDRAAKKAAAEKAAAEATAAQQAAAGHQAAPAEQHAAQ